MASRRDVLKQLGMGMTAMTITGAAAIKSSAFAAFADEASDQNAPWWLFAPLQEGTSVGKGWRIKKLGGIKEGASILSLEHCESAQI